MGLPFDFVRHFSPITIGTCSACKFGRYVHSTSYGANKSNNDFASRLKVAFYLIVSDIVEKKNIFVNRFFKIKVRVHNYFTFEKMCRSIHITKIENMIKYLKSGVPA